MSEENISTQTNAQDHGRFLEFNLGREKFGIPLLSVKEVIAVPETTKVPFSPDYYLGIMNLRGQVLSVIDLRKRMNIQPNEDSAETAVIIVELGYTHLGVIVDSINRVIAVGEDDFAPPPEVDSGSTNDEKFITGCFKNEKNLVLFLDIDKILDSKDRQLLSSQDQHMDEAS